MAAEKKLAEANECIRQAEKCLKTGFLKWRPDYDNAASEYSKAATAFKAAKALQEGREALLKAADSYGRNQSYFSAGKSLEQAAFVSKDLEEYDKVVEYVSRACQLFREHGSPDTAAMVLEKGAKMIDHKLPDKAIELYCKAAEIVSLEERSKQAADYAGKASRLLVKLRRYDEAITMLRKELMSHLEAEDGQAAGRLTIALCLLHLTLEDFVAADKVFKEFGSYVGRDEKISLVEVLEGFDEGDPEQIYRALDNPFFKHMDIEYAKLARNLQNQFAAQKNAKKAAAAVAAAEASSSNATKEDYSGLL